MESTADQRAYDRGSTIFSPDGRLYQVEYAREAVERGSATVGVRTDGGVALVSDVRRRSPLLDRESIEKLHDVDGSIAIGTAGHVADARRLVKYAREDAQRERLRFGEAPEVETISRSLADFVQESTQTGGTRPFGAALLVAGVVDEPRLFEVDPSGSPVEWRATAIGDGSSAIQSFLEEEYREDLGLEDSVSLALEATAEAAEDPIEPDDVDVAVTDDVGYRRFDAEQRRSALADADLSADP